MMRKRKIENRLLKIVNLEKRKRKKRFFIKREKELVCVTLKLLYVFQGAARSGSSAGEA